MSILEVNPSYREYILAIKPRLTIQANPERFCEQEEQEQGEEAA